jgi:hypothetical protein
VSASKSATPKKEEPLPCSPALLADLACHPKNVQLNCAGRQHAGLLYEGGLTVAIIKKVKDKRPAKTGQAIRDITQPSISYTDDDLPTVITTVWATPGHILDRDGKGVPTTQAAQEASDLINNETGMKLKRAVIITEEEHDNDYTMQDDDEVVFVLPNRTRVVANANNNQLLESAKLLMACTPNGI